MIANTANDPLIECFMVTPYNFMNFQFNLNLQILAAFKTFILFILDSGEQNTSVLSQNLYFQLPSVQFLTRYKIRNAFPSDPKKTVADMSESRILLWESVSRSKAVHV